MNNGRDCPHGRQVGKCDTCDLIAAELELQKVTAERDALAARLSEIEKSDSQEVLSLKADNQALSAHVEALREAYASYTESGFDEILSDAFEATPQHHLAELRAEAGRDGFFKGVAWILDVDLKDISAMVAEEAAKQYAEQIRQEGK